MSEPEYVGVEQLAAILGYSRQTIYRLVREKAIAPLKVGTGRRVLRFDRAEVVATMKERLASEPHPL